jgi:dihydrofolate synthase/folylpolyglutamate synthase
VTVASGDMTPARAYLYSLEHIGIKLGLEQIRGLLAALGSPERNFPTIAIAGTNGKGSVTAMLERGLRAAGYRTGRFTSPHLIRLEERFTIDGKDVEAEVLDAAIEHVQHAAVALPAPPTFFEVTTAAALDLFRAAAVDVALLEVGLGGRLDSTNAADACASVITAVDLDHQQYLGDTLDAIAAEKAGVIKPGTFCVLADNAPTVESVVAGQCARVGATLVRASEGTVAAVRFERGRAQLDLTTPVATYAGLTLALRGRHQVHNATAAIRMLEELDLRTPFAISVAARRTAVEDVQWPGRLEHVRVHGVETILDGAHNAAGAQALAAYLSEAYPGRRLPLVIGVLRDKNAAAMLSALAPRAAHLFCTAPTSPRAIPPHELGALVSTIAPGVDVEVSDDPDAAIRTAARHGAPVVVAGSLYLVGEVRARVS